MRSSWVRRAAMLVLLTPLFLLASMAVAAAPSAGQTYTPADEINVRAAGAQGDGVTSDTAVLQQLVRRYPAATLLFPAGTYLLDNRGIDSVGLDFEGFSGTVRMEGGARFSCDTANLDAGQCILVKNSSNAVFYNLSITYKALATLPLPRDACAGFALFVVNAHNIMFWNTTILGSSGPGAWNTDSTAIGYFGVTRITRTSADGIHFENVGNASVENLYTDNTGDDAIGDTNIAPSNPNCGLFVGRAEIHNSRARGIAVAGGCGAIFNNVQITGTTDSALSTSQDLTIGSRIPTNVKFSHVIAKDVGQLAGVKGNGTCIDIADSTFVSVTDVSCDDSKDSGVFIYSNHVQGTTNHILIQNVTVRSTGNNGFESAGSSNVSFVNDKVTAAAGSGFSVLKSTHVVLKNCVSDTTAGYGFFHSGSSDVTESNLTAHNTATLPKGLHRVWWAESMTGALSVNGLAIVDDQTTANGYIVGDAMDASAPINVTNITFNLKHGKPSIQRYSTDSKYFLRGQSKPAPQSN